MWRAKLLMTRSLSFLCNSLNLIGNGWLQSSNSECVILVNVVLEEPPQEEIWGIQIRQVRCRFTSALRLMRRFPNFLRIQAMMTFRGVRRDIFLLKPLFFLIKVFTVIKLSSELLKH